MADERLWLIGPGRLGLALGWLLHRSGAVPGLIFSGRGPGPPAHPLFEGDDPPASYASGIDLPDPPPTAVILTVPDSAIEETAGLLAEIPLPFGIPVLHTSGSLGVEALAPLVRFGVPVGSLHPLAAVAHPIEGADRLRGAWFALEGDPVAVRAGERIVEAAAGRVLPVPSEAKAVYHAAAVLASNSVVALLAAAERIAADAGIPRAAAREALAELAIGAAENVRGSGPEAALTGPISRGDLDTVRRHLERLSGSDRALYSSLAREALALARSGGLDAETADRLDRLLAEAE